MGRSCLSCDAQALGETGALARSGVADDTYFNLASAYLALAAGALPQARTLYDALQAQLTHVDLSIVPHGALHYLPWSALPLDDQHDLIDRHAVRVLPSASVLTLLRTPRGAAGMLALGNPDLGDAALDLPGAQQEVEAIAAKHPGTVTRLRAKASESLIKREGARYPLLHIASHGYFESSNALASGLMLAPGDGEDGRLTVTELYGLKLDADLVTLSACETGLGGLANGDDVIGLTRGFFYAGASSVVASLWAVSDDATAQLMVAFYESPAGTDRRGALRRAQLAVRDGGHAHPYFWAPWQLSGHTN